MSALPIVVIGHAALDRVYRIAEFPARPTKVRALEHIEDGGGMAANAAAAIARLGVPVELWSRTGDDQAGARIRALLATGAVDVSYLRAHPGSRSSTSAIIVDSHGERLVVSERDHAMPMDPGWLPLERLGRTAVVLSDVSWIEGTVAAFERARSLGVPTMADADQGSEHVIERLIHLVDYAIFSAAALDLYLPNLSWPERFDHVLARGVRHVGVTRGPEGYLWRARDGEIRTQPAFVADVVDTTGAGDAFHGAFAWALRAQCDDATCALIASAAAALKCRKLGARAGLPTALELDGYLLDRTGHGLCRALAKGGA